MKEAWLMSGAVVPVDVETTAALLVEIKRLIGVVGGMALAQPEFIKHEVENADDWSEWVCPDPKGYLLKCCDCGLVHEMQTRVAQYVPVPSEEFEVVKDADVQAQLRLRRSEAWTPEDRAYRPNGLAQPEQQQEQE